MKLVLIKKCLQISLKKCKKMFVRPRGGQLCDQDTVLKILHNILLVSSELNTTSRQGKTYAVIMLISE